MALFEKFNSAIVWGFIAQIDEFYSGDNGNSLLIFLVILLCLASAFAGWKIWRQHLVIVAGISERQELEEKLQAQAQQLESVLQQLEQAKAQFAEEIEKKKQAPAQQLESALQKLQRAEAQLVESNRFTKLGQLTPSIVHELNNPVYFIHGNIKFASEYNQNFLKLINLYQKHYPDANPEITTFIEEIEFDYLKEDSPQILSSMTIGLDRIRELLMSLRNFLRLYTTEMKPENIHELIDGMIFAGQKFLYLSGINIIKEYGELPLVECYGGQLIQVFWDILTNAAHAVAVKEVHVRNTIDAKIEIHTSVINSDWVKISIKDNGSGMNESVKERIFEPLFSTKPVGQGIGLGLSISRKIVVENHGGKLECISEPGEGTEFVIELPIQQSSTTK